MAGSLIQRYTYGNFVDLPMLSPEADFYLGGPERQRELVTLSKMQLTAFQDVTAAVRDSNLQTAGIISNELQRQFDDLKSVIASGTDSIVSAVDDLGDRLSGELVEIRWELAQLAKASDQILEVLRRPRSTEARELLQQGIRNLVNEKIEPAEDRFKRALELDNTDYQVLMNLSAVELHKGDPVQAILYVRDALTLPQNLDNRAKGEALWSMARIRYAVQEYDIAFKVGKESLRLVTTPRRRLQLGIYAVLAGDVLGGLDLVREAIQQLPSLFGIAMSTPDLAGHRESVLALLDRLVTEAIVELRDESVQLEQRLVDTPCLDDAARMYRERFAIALRSLAELTKSRDVSYLDLRDGLLRLPILRFAPFELQKLHDLGLELANAENAKYGAEDRWKSAGAKTMPEAIPFSGCGAFGIASIAGLVLLQFEPFRSMFRDSRDAVQDAVTVLILWGPVVGGIVVWALLWRINKTRYETLGIASRSLGEIESRIVAAKAARDASSKAVSQRLLDLRLSK
jgi:tetratricopeptide (TPR) repeat protein